MGIYEYSHQTPPFWGHEAPRSPTQKRRTKQICDEEREGRLAAPGGPGPAERHCMKAGVPWAERARVSGAVLGQGWPELRDMAHCPWPKDLLYVYLQVSYTLCTLRYV